MLSKSYTIRIKFGTCDTVAICINRDICSFGYVLTGWIYLFAIFYPSYKTLPCSLRKRRRFKGI